MHVIGGLQLSGSRWKNRAGHVGRQKHVSTTDIGKSNAAHVPHLRDATSWSGPETVRCRTPASRPWRMQVRQGRATLVRIVSVGSGTGSAASMRIYIAVPQAITLDKADQMEAVGDCFHSLQEPDLPTRAAIQPPLHIQPTSHLLSLVCIVPTLESANPRPLAKVSGSSTRYLCADQTTTHQMETKKECHAIPNRAILPWLRRRPPPLLAPCLPRSRLGIG